MLNSAGEVTEPEPALHNHMDGPGRGTLLRFPAIRYVSTSTISQEAVLL